jgi:type III secretion protein Q
LARWEASVIQPVTFRQLSRDQLGHFRHLGVSRREIKFTAADADWTLKLQTDRRNVPGRSSIRADWGGAQIVLRIAESTIASLAARFLNCDYAAGMAEPLRTIVLEAAFAEMAGLFEEATRKRFSVLSVDERGSVEDHCSGFGFSLDDGKFVCEGELWVDDLGLGFLAAAVRLVDIQKRAISAFDDVSVRLYLDVGWTNLSFATFRQLEKRDLILLDECWIAPGSRIFLRAGRQVGLPAEIEESRIVITGELGEIMYDDAHDDQDDDNESENEKTLDGIQMRVSFDLGQRSMTLGELRQLSPGYVFELGRPVRSAVNIRANGKLIGEGELVDVDGQMAVSILNLTLAAE